MGHKPPEAVCPTPHKIYFTTKQWAKTYLKERAHYYSKKAPKIYIYHCQCGGFHFTKTQRFDNPYRPKAKTLVHEDRFKQLLKK